MESLSLRETFTFVFLAFQNVFSCFLYLWNWLIADWEEVDGGSHLIRKSVCFKNKCSNTLHWVQSVSHVNLHEQILLRKTGSAQKDASVEGLATPFSFLHTVCSQACTYALCRFGVWVNRALAASCGHHESFYITGLLRIFLVTEKICSNKNSWALLAIPPVSGTVGIIHLEECGRSLTPLLYILKYLPSFANKVTASPFLRDNICCMHVVLKLLLNNFLHVFSRMSPNSVHG